MSRSRLNLLVALAALLVVPTLCLAQGVPPPGVDKAAEAAGRKLLAEICESIRLWINSAKCHKPA